MRTGGCDRCFLGGEAEHGPGVSVLITWYEPLVEEVYAALEKRLAKLERGDLARESLERYGAIVLAPRASLSACTTSC